MNSCRKLWFALAEVPVTAMQIRKAVLLAVFLLCLVMNGFVSFAAIPERSVPQVTYSQDGTPIAYDLVGAGEPAMVFVHGWSCDSRYWRNQVPVFSRDHLVATLDLAGHGHSGSQRAVYSMPSLGEDVRAVVEAIGSNKVILIGHSMGGIVIGEAAKLMPDKVLGLIGVDTLENVEYRMTSEESEQMVTPLAQDFPNGVKQFVGQMLGPDSKDELRQWILSDMASAPPVVALSAMREMMQLYISGDVAKLFDSVTVPVIGINADLWPVDYAANRRHMRSYEATVLKGADHFLMLNRPDEFNKALAEAVGNLSKK